MSVKESMYSLLESLDEAGPDWKSAATKLMKNYTKKTQDHFIIRSYLRAIEQGNQAQATHIAKSVMPKKTADTVRKALIDLAGK